MSNYEIYRYKKLKSKTAITHALNHNLRVGKQQSNVDTTQSHKNVYRGLDTKAKCNARRDAVLGRLGKKPRANAVLAHEVLVTASPEVFNDENFNQVKYFNDALAHVAQLHGGVDNIVSAAVHYDEETPHMHLIVMPVVDGKLNSRAVIGGHAKRMSELQTLFHKQVGAVHGLSRGEINSKRKHNPIGKINKQVQERQLQLKSLDSEYETKLERSQSLSKTISEQEATIGILEDRKARIERANMLGIDELRSMLNRLEQEQANANRPSMRR